MYVQSFISIGLVEVIKKAFTRFKKPFQNKEEKEIQVHNCL